MDRGIILCVDDQPAVLDSLMMQLEDAVGEMCDIETAENAAEALAFLDDLDVHGELIEMVIADEVMPGMKGSRLLEVVHHRYPEALKVMLTGQAGLDAVTYVINHARLDKYFTKPWEYEDLKLTVTSLLEKSRLVRKNRQLSEELRTNYEELQRTYGELDTAYKQLQETQVQLIHADTDTDVRRIAEDIWNNRPNERQFLEHMLMRDGSLHVVVPDVLRALDALCDSFANGHTLFLCGNGGSSADCMHIAGELMKSFNLRRQLSDQHQAQFNGIEFGDMLTVHLEEGLPCLVLGFNHSLNSAILNDSRRYEVQYAQELHVLGKPGDVLWGISTSGNALNVLYAVSTAKARGIKTIGMTGHAGGKLAQSVDIAIKAPATVTSYVQEQHSILYHALCAMLETRFFS
jgi:D-sedoheptulose 7-phosphate isomerase